MNRIALALALASALLLNSARAQMNSFFPGPGMPAAAAGGCTMNGTLDFSGTHTCNLIYYMTGVIQ